MSPQTQTAQEAEDELNELEHSQTRNGRGEVNAAIASFAGSIFFFLMTLSQDPWDDQGRKNEGAFWIWSRCMIAGGILMAVSLVLGVIGIVVKVLYKRMKANAPDVPLSNLTSGEDRPEQPTQLLPSITPSAPTVPEEEALAPSKPHTPPPSYAEAMNSDPPIVLPGYSEAMEEPKKEKI